MATYASYKDSGEQWLGQIPSHWEVKRLGSYFVERRVKVSDKVYAPLSVTKNGILPQLENVAKSNDSDNRKLVCAGDFVINSRSDRKGSSGVSPLDGSVSLINIVLQPRKGIVPAFCNYLLKSRNFVEEYYRNGRGIVADLWTTRYDEMKAIKLAMPSLDEQNAMVAYLDEATSQIDEAIAQQQRMIDLLNERKQIIIQNAVTKGLNLNVPMKDSGIDGLGEVPEHWNVLPIKRCCDLIREKAIESTNYRVSLENIESWTGQYVYTDSEYAGAGVKFEKGDILFGKLRPYLAKVLLADKEGEALGDIWVLRSNSRITFEYLHTVLLSRRVIDTIDSSTYGAKMPRADWETNSKVRIAVPPIGEQENIISYLSQILVNVNKQILLCKKQISFLNERKQIIINDVVTGKVKVD